MERNLGAKLEYLSLSKFGKFNYKLVHFFKSIPLALLNFLKAIPLGIWKMLKGIGHYFYGIYEAARYGDYKTRLSFVIFGFGNFTRKQYGRGILMLVYEISFILYMVFFGGKYLGKFGTLGTIPTHTSDSGFKVVGDNSFLILLFSVMTIIIIFATFMVWTMSVKSAYAQQMNQAINRKLATMRDDLRGFTNENFHVTLLSLPTVLLVTFTVLPLLFMILVAFTNYNETHMPPEKLFTWVGGTNFKTLLSGEGLVGDSANFSYAFWRVLLWTLIWAILATSTNFFLGLILALLINKKGIRGKKFWRTALVTVIAVPQFISLMLMSKMLTPDGIYNSILQACGLEPVKWLLSPKTAKMTVILVNLWVGIPYTVISVSGILMNIPADLYEAARIDGANPYKMFVKITLPYTMFVMGPSLITTFTGNLNNFNIIFLLSGGTTGVESSKMASAYAGDTDLLITWLYKLTVNQRYYDMGSAIGILIFIIVASISLIVYSHIGSNKNEEDFQ